MGPIGGQSLGSARFSLYADSEPLEVALAKSAKAAETASAKIASSLGRRSQAGQSLMQLGYILDDLQYGFHSIVNNLPQLTMALGMGAGVGGAIGIAGVAVSQLLGHWEDLMAVFNGEGAKTAASWAKQLADDTAQANEQAEKLLKTLTPIQEQQKKIVEGGVGKAGAENVQAAIEDALISIHRFKQHKPGIMDFLDPSNRLGLQNETELDQRKKVGERAKNLFGTAGTNEDSRRVVRDLIKALPDAFAGVPDFVKGIAAADPKRLAETDVLNKAGAENEAIQKTSEATQKIIEAKIEKQFQAGMQAMDMELDRIKGNWEENHRKELQNKQDFIQGKENQAHAIEMSVRNREPSQIFGSTHAFANSMMTAAMDSPIKQAHKDAQAIHEQVRLLRQELVKAQRVRWEE